MSSTSTHLAEPAHDMSAFIDSDLPCAECGYNLRTINLNANCPECGTAVVISTRGDRLATAPPDWLKTIARGAWWLRASVILALPVVYLGVPLSAFGVWCLTTVQPGRVEPSFDRGYRTTARMVTLLGALWITLLIVGALITVLTTDQRLMGSWNMSLLGSASAAHGGWLDNLPAYDVMFLVSHAVYVLGLLTTWRYLGVLAQRVPDDELASACRGLVRAWLVSVVVLVVVSGLTNLLIALGIIPGGSSEYWVPITVGLIFAVVLMALWVATHRVMRRLAATLSTIR